MEKIPVNRPSIFTVESDPNLAVPEVQVLSPSRRPLGVDVVPHGGGRYNVQFTPTDVGEFEKFILVRRIYFCWVAVISAKNH